MKAKKKRRKAKPRKTKRKWIQEALRFHRAGALHRSLGVPLSEAIPLALLKVAAKRHGRLGRRARLAKTLRGLRKRKKAKTKKS